MAPIHDFLWLPLLSSGTFLKQAQGFARGLRGRDDNSSDKTRNTSSFLKTRSRGVRRGCYWVSGRGTRPAFQPSLKCFCISMSHGAGGAPWARAMQWKTRLVFPPRVAVQECRSDGTCCFPCQTSISTNTAHTVVITLRISWAKLTPLCSHLMRVSNLL